MIKADLDFTFYVDGYMSGGLNALEIFCIDRLSYLVS